MTDNTISSTGKNSLEDEMDSQSGLPRKKLKVDSNCTENGSLVTESNACSSTTPSTSSNRDNKESINLVPMTINQAYLDGTQILKNLYSNESNTYKDDNVCLFVNKNCNIVRNPFQVTQLGEFVQDECMLQPLIKAISKMGKSFSAFCHIWVLICII